MSIESEREEKQTFLKEEILDKNFDAEAFINFCEKDRGADIDLWTFDELKQCVKNFTSQILQKQYSNGDLTVCKILKPSRLTGQQVKVILTIPEKSISTATSQKLLVINVITLPVGWNVQRKLSDFIWLAETLPQEFPGLYIPLISSKKSNKKLDGPSDLACQIKKLSLFINFITASDLLKRSTSLIAFLQEEDHQKLSKLKKTKVKKPADVKDFCTADGQIACEYENMQEYTTKMSEFFETYRLSLKKLAHEGKSITKSISDLYLSFGNYSLLLKSTGEILSQMPVYTRPSKELFSKMSESYAKINEKIMNVSIVINEHVQSSTKFFKNQGLNLKATYKEKDTAFSEVDTLKKKIAKIVAKDKGINKEITDKCRDLTAKAGVLNYMCREQTEKMLKYSINMFFEDCCELCSKLTTELTGILTTMAMLVDSVEISKSLL